MWYCVVLGSYSLTSINTYVGIIQCNIIQDVSSFLFLFITYVMLNIYINETCYYVFADNYYTIKDVDLLIIYSYNC